eukprot:624082-Hanusia_phi.AAC.12
MRLMTPGAVRQEEVRGILSLVDSCGSIVGLNGEQVKTLILGAPGASDSSTQQLAVNLFVRFSCHSGPEETERSPLLCPNTESTT